MKEFDRVAFTELVATNCEEKATREAIFELLDFADHNALKVEGGLDSKSFHYMVGIKGGGIAFCFGVTQLVMLKLIIYRIFKREP